MSDETTRDRFEQWIKSHTRTFSLERYSDDQWVRPDLQGEYETLYVQLAWEAWQEADNNTQLLHLLADIRAAVGDPEGKLDWPGLVEHCRMLREYCRKMANDRRRLRWRWQAAVRLLAEDCAYADGSRLYCGRTGYACGHGSSPAHFQTYVMRDGPLYPTPEEAVRAAIAEEIEREQ